jgi:hypothetical protein
MLIYIKITLHTYAQNKYFPNSHFSKIENIFYYT